MRASWSFGAVSALLVFGQVSALQQVAKAAPAEVLSIAQAQQEARTHSPAAAEADAVYQGAVHVAAAAGYLFPDSPVLSSKTHPRQVGGHEQGSTSWTYGLSLPVDISGARSGRKDAAQLRLDVAKHQRDQSLRLLDRDVAVAAADLAEATAAAARSDRITALYDIASQAAQSQMRTGDLGQIEVDSAALAAASARADMQRSRAALEAAQIRLAQLLGRPAPAGLTMAPSPALSMPTASPSFDTLAVATPATTLAAAERDAARLESQATQRATYPVPSLSVEYERDVGESRELANTAGWTFGVSVPLSVFSSGREQVARAESSAQAAEAALTHATSQNRAKLAAAWSDLVAATQAFQTLRDVPAVIDRNLRMIEQSVQAGAMDVVTRAEALRRLVDSGRQVDKAARDLQVAYAEWLFLTGGGTGNLPTLSSRVSLQNQSNPRLWEIR